MGAGETSKGEMCDKLPKEKRVISCKWLFKVKDGIPGVESKQYKARFRAGTITDVKTTFLHGHLEEEIYVEQPEGFKVPGKEDHVCRLKKSLYGLKQSPRQWYKRFDSMIGHGYDRCSYDECVYLRKFPDGSFLYLVLYVDDMLIDAHNKDQIRELKDQLSNEFDMKDLGAAVFVYRLHFKSSQEVQHEQLQTRSYSVSIHECPKSEEDKEDMSRVPYSSAVGSLMYAMVCTRPDLAHAVSVVSRYMHNPGKIHWEAFKCILRYLKGTSNIGLSFEKSRASLNGVVGYIDSDYAGDLDARKSLYSYIFSHCGSAISWYSSLQAITALSTTEAEYISSTEGVKEAIWLRGMVNEFGLHQEVLVVYCDNQSVVHLTKNNKFHSKTKHIEVRHHFVRDIVEKGEVIVDKIHTNDNPADMLTKVLTPTKFKHCLDLVGVIGV
ncbi:retrovirus-related pol polyprotein from transposon TNT 1-94 [Tanacetum coccineum]